MRISRVSGLPPDTASDTLMVASPARTHCTSLGHRESALTRSNLSRNPSGSVAVVVAAACGSPTSPDAVAGRPFDLKAGATATLPDGLRLKFDRVSADSRCPSDVQCVRAGEATISVSLAVSGGSPETREMRTDPSGSQIAYGNHTIRLERLAPYPKSIEQIRPQDYVATFVVQIP